MLRNILNLYRRRGIKFRRQDKYGKGRRTGIVRILAGNFNTLYLSLGIKNNYVAQKRLYKADLDVRGRLAVF
jgi:hypothetical protein